MGCVSLPGRPGLSGPAAEYGERLRPAPITNHPRKGAEFQIPHLCLAFRGFLWYTVCQGNCLARNAGGKILSLGKENGCPRDETGWTGPFWLGRPCGTSWACRRALSQARHPDPPGTETNPLEGDTHEETIGKTGGGGVGCFCWPCVWGLWAQYSFCPTPWCRMWRRPPFRGCSTSPSTARRTGRWTRLRP